MLAYLIEEHGVGVYCTFTYLAIWGDVNVAHIYLYLLVS